jgi:hypothetical protein
VIEKVYIETTIVSYLTSRPSGDSLTRSHQELTRDWWDRRRAEFEIYVSESFSMKRREVTEPWQRLV